MRKTYGSSRAGSGNAYPTRQHHFEAVDITTERQEHRMQEYELSTWLDRAYPKSARIITSDMKPEQVGVWRPESRDQSDILVYELRNGRPFCVSDGRYKELAEFGGVYDSQEQ